MKYGILFKSNDHIPSPINVDSQVNERMDQERSIFNEFFFCLQMSFNIKKAKVSKVSLILNL